MQGCIESKFQLENPIQVTFCTISPPKPLMACLALHVSSPDSPALTGIPRSSVFGGSVAGG